MLVSPSVGPHQRCGSPAKCDRSSCSGNTLRVQDTAPTIGSIPTGAELQERFANLEVPDYEITSEAERAWKHGDQMASEDAAKKAH